MVGGCGNDLKNVREEAEQSSDLHSIGKFLKSNKTVEVSLT